MKLRKKYKLLFITLTFKNTKNIDKKEFKEMRSKFTKNFLRRKPINKIIMGGIYSFDWTINEMKKKHPFNIHIHLIAFSKAYINYKLLSKKWHEATGDSYITDIRKVKNVNKAIFEVQKYIQSNKSIMHCEEKTREKLIHAIQGTRRSSKFGICYKMKIPKKEAICNECQTGMIHDYHTKLFPELWGYYPTKEETEIYQMKLKIKEKKRS